MSSSEAPTIRYATIYNPGCFEAGRHFYPKILNSTLHNTLDDFFGLDNNRIALRYSQLNPTVSTKEVLHVLNNSSKLFRWAGADLFNVLDEHNRRQMLVVETNSCPSGQKSMPMLPGTTDEQNGFHRLMRDVFRPWILDEENKGNLPQGVLAVVYDKNPMEALGYAHAFSTVMDEQVYAVEHYHDDQNPPSKWIDGVFHVRVNKALSDETPNEEWLPVRAVFRYVTQKPWTRIPLSPKTLIVNPIEACIAGGRNKLSAANAYQVMNNSLPEGLKIRSPLTVMDVAKEDVGKWIDHMGGMAVVKVPYANAGQGVWTVTNEQERNEVVDIALNNKYDKFVVQALIGVREWNKKIYNSTPSTSVLTNKTVYESVDYKECDLNSPIFHHTDVGNTITVSAANNCVPPIKMYTHVGTVPDKKNNSYVCDVRMMVGSTASGYKPIAIYARRAALPTSAANDETLQVGSKSHSWDILGTNLSIKLGGNSWDSDTQRLVSGATKEWPTLGLSIDDLIDAYVQTCLATSAIDKAALDIRAKGVVGVREACNDEALVDETMWQWK